MNVRERYSRAVKVNVEAIVEEAFDDTLVNLADINRERMLDGVRSDGSMMPNYSYVSVTKYGYPPGPIRLKATGAFQAGIFVSRTGRTLITDSTDSKSPMLQTRYGKEIFGTGGDYKTEYIDKYLRPALINRLRAVI